jgi:ABC-type transporter Mla subunit MlaD
MQTHPKSTTADELAALSSEVENLAASIQVLGDQVEEHEQSVASKLDQLLQLNTQMRADSMWNGMHV